MRTAGIDIGSRTIKLVVMEGTEIVHNRVIDTTFDPMAACNSLLEGHDFDAILATGYGRRLFGEKKGCSVITEIKAVAIGDGCTEWYVLS